MVFCNAVSRVLPIRRSVQRRILYITHTQVTVSSNRRVRGVVSGMSRLRSVIAGHDGRMAGAVW